MYFPSLEQILQYTIYGITVGGIYALVALGFTIIYNATDVINFAQGEFVMLGAMMMVSLHSVANISTPVAFLLSVLIVTAIGAVFERLAINPVKNASVITLIIITGLVILSILILIIKRMTPKVDSQRSLIGEK